MSSMYTRSQLRKIYDKTNGYCHLCGKRLSFKNYDRHGSRAPWNVDHSKTQAMGGTDHMNNLYPACISCNSSKGTKTNRSVRRSNSVFEIPGQMKKSLSGWFWATSMAIVGLFVLNAWSNKIQTERTYYGR